MHKVELTRTAEEAYRWLYRRDRRFFERITVALWALADDPALGKRLKGVFEGDWSCRIGSYRIIYTIVEARGIVLILDIAHRRESYR